MLVKMPLHQSYVEGGGGRRDGEEGREGWRDSEGKEGEIMYIIAT